MQKKINGGINNESLPPRIFSGLPSNKKVNDVGAFTNQILLNGITAEQLVDLFRPMIREEVQLVISQQEEKLISPAEACKLFKPAITKATLTSWTKQGFLQEHRIGGRVFYRQSEILASTITLGKYKSIYSKMSA